MRRTLHILLTASVAVNCLFLITLMRMVNQLDHTQTPDNEQTLADQESRMGLEQLVTVVIREFDDLHSKLSDTVQSISQTSQHLRILVVSDEPMYPPVNLPNNVRCINLKPDVRRSNKLQDIRKYIRSKYILIVPAGFVLNTKEQLKSMIDEYKDSKSKLLVSQSTAEKTKSCEHVELDYKRWSLTFTRSSSVHCVMPREGDVILVDTSTYLNLPEPFARPVHTSLAIQTSVQRVKIQKSKVKFTVKKWYSSEMDLWKYRSKSVERLKQLYRNLDIKFVRHVESGKTLKTEWFGCQKDTRRCFDTVVDDIPDYIYAGRLTPPCCLRSLRVTAKHVFDTLEKSDVRYWLEGGSLLGAVRHGDIIPWDYDVDIGIYQEDIPKCELLKKAALQAIVDEDGFVWERAIEGQFYRVQFSETNRLHVDIFPFFPKNGVMTKKTWIKTHRQDTEFSENYLKPREKLDFAGMKVWGPNNARKFLEYKFGVGVIENPKYPNQENLIKHLTLD